MLQRTRGAEDDEKGVRGGVVNEAVWTAHASSRRDDLHRAALPNSCIKVRSLERLVCFVSSSWVSWCAGMPLAAVLLEPSYMWAAARQKGRWFN